MATYHGFALNLVEGESGSASVRLEIWITDTDAGSAVSYKEHHELPPVEDVDDARDWVREHLHALLEAM